MDVNRILITEHVLHLLQYLNVPYDKRKYLSPVYLHTSLGRSAGTNPFVEYRSLTGQMGYSKNRRTFSLYSGLFCKMLIYLLLTIVGIIHPCVWLQQITHTCLLTIPFASIISKHLLPSGHRQPMYRL